MSLIKVEENGKLLRASAVFGRSKQVAFNFHGGFTYIHLSNRIGGVQVSLGMDELEELLDLIVEEWVNIDERFNKEVSFYAYNVT